MCCIQNRINSLKTVFSFVYSNMNFPFPKMKRVKHENSQRPKIEFRWNLHFFLFQKSVCVWYVRVCMACLFQINYGDVVWCMRYALLERNYAVESCLSFGLWELVGIWFFFKLNNEFHPHSKVSFFSSFFQLFIYGFRLTFVSHSFKTFDFDLLFASLFAFA